MSILSFHKLSQYFGAADIFSGLTATIARQEKVGLVGPNGVGKTSLLRILAGCDRPRQGDYHLAKNVTVGYLQQEAIMAFTDHKNTIFEEMLSVFVHLEEMAIQLREKEQRMSRNDFSDELLSRYGRVQAAYERAGGYDYDVRIKQVLTVLGFVATQWNMPLAHCSGGQKTRVLLARLLLETPDLLILDEPTNHLDEPTNHLDILTQEILQDALQSFSGTILLVFHDRFLIDKLATQIREIRGGRLPTHRGSYRSFLAGKMNKTAVALPE